MYGPILLRERAAATMCRFWRCARARQIARRKRGSNALAARVNPLVRGFLARRATGKMFEERGRRNRSVLLVRKREQEGWLAGWLADVDCMQARTGWPFLHPDLISNRAWT